MTLLPHDHDLRHGPVRQDREADRQQTGANAAREAAMRGFLRLAIAMMAGATALAGVIALKTGIYLPHFNY